MKSLMTLVCLGLVASADTARAAEKKPLVKIKLATLAPSGTSYHKSLLAMGEKWRQATDGAVELTVHADGKQGGETDVVGLMGLNSVQAGLLTAVGLAEIEHAVAGLQSLPMSFRTFEEVDYVGEKLQPMLEQRLLAKGFVVLFWSDSGWVRFFSKKPLLRPDDLRKMKLFTWAGNADQVEIYKAAGFNPVPLETADIPTGIRTDLINAIPMPPFVALHGQIDSTAPYMLDLNWAPLVGALVITKKTWDKIPDAVKEPMRKAALEAGQAIKARGRAESEESVAAMQKRGLKVNKVTPEIELEWRARAEAVNPKIRGRIVPADIFDKVQALLNEYRASKGQSQ